QPSADTTTALTVAMERPAVPRIARPLLLAVVALLLATFTLYWISYGREVHPGLGRALGAPAGAGPPIVGHVLDVGNSTVAAAPAAVLGVAVQRAVPANAVRPVTRLHTTSAVPVAGPTVALPTRASPAPGSSKPVAAPAPTISPGTAHGPSTTPTV